MGRSGSGVAGLRIGPVREVGRSREVGRVSDYVGGLPISVLAALFRKDGKVGS